jgi:pimeloyl-ACP methyl ester carboxylesterase
MQHEERILRRNRHCILSARHTLRANPVSPLEWIPVMTDTEMKRTKILVAGTEVEVRSAGTQGRTLLFLHPGDGLEGDNATLLELSRSFRVIAPSHPGFGESALPPHYRSVDDLAYFYLDFLESQDLRDVILVGVSFGGWIAASIAIKNTDRIAGIVLAGALGARFGEVQTREIADLFAYPLYEQPKFLYQDPARRQMKFDGLSDEVLLKLARNHESFALYGWSPTLHDPQLARRLHRIKVPVHFLWGEEDRVVPVELGRKYAAAIAGAGFDLIPGAGHYLHVERPQAFAEAVGRFAGSLPQAVSAPVTA